MFVSWFQRTLNSRVSVKNTIQIYILLFYFAFRDFTGCGEILSNDQNINNTGKETVSAHAEETGFIRQKRKKWLTFRITGLKLGLSMQRPF